MLLLQPSVISCLYLGGGGWGGGTQRERGYISDIMHLHDLPADTNVDFFTMLTLVFDISSIKHLQPMHGHGHIANVSLNFCEMFHVYIVFLFLFFLEITVATW